MARIVDFFDGAQSETAPTIGNIIASGIIQYPDDATYEANEQNAPLDGNIYYNTTSDLLRYYSDGVWSDIVDEDSLQAVINKTIDADVNTISNLEDDNIKTGAAINVEKLADGSVDNSEFQYLDGVTSSIQTQLNAKQETSEKGQVNGYAPLDASSKVPLANLPIDDIDNVDEYANFAAFPVTGLTDRIYITADTNETYRWSGSVYVKIGSSVEELSDLTDVDTAGVTDGQILKYVNANSQFEPADPVAELDDLSDVDTATVAPTTNDILQYDGSNFVPVALPSSANLNVVTIDQTGGTYIPSASDDVILVDGSSGPVSIDLPTAVGITGKIYRVKKITADAAPGIIQGFGPQLLDATATKRVTYQYETISIVSDGVHWKVLSDLEKKSRVSAWRNGNVTVASSTNVQIILNSVLFDTNSNYNAGTGQFTATRDGIYQINVGQRWLPIAVNATFFSVIQVNGSTVFQSQLPSNSTVAGGWHHVYSHAVELSVGDVVTIVAIQNTGSNQTVLGNNTLTFMSILEQ